MYCKKPSPVIILLRNTVIVFVVFMLVDYIYYGLISPGDVPYSTDIGNKIIFTVLFAVFYAHLYNKTSRIWRPNSDEAFLFKKTVVSEADLCKLSLPKILNGVVFSLLISGLIIFAMHFLTFIFSTIFIDILHGIRGELPGGSKDVAIIISKVVISGVVLEAQGKTDDDPDR